MPLSKVTKTSTFLLMMICCYLEAGAAPVAPSVNTEPVLECKDITVPSKEKIQISHEGNLYHFKFALPACGHASYQNQYPASFIVQELIDDFYKSGMLNITVTQDPASDPLAKDKFLLEVQQSILGKRFDYKEEVQLVYERNFIHMINQSHTIPGSVSKTLEPYQLLRDIQWKNDCEQESAGWCFTWDGYFSITWEWDKHQDLEEMKNQVFKESYIRYENYIYKVANPLEKNKT